MDSLSKKHSAKFLGVVNEYVETYFKFPNVHRWLLNMLDKYFVSDKLDDKATLPILCSSLKVYNSFLDANVYNSYLVFYLNSLLFPEFSMKS